MKTLLTTALLLLSHFCFSQTATQQQSFWVELDRPTGGMVFSLAVNSITEVYAGMGNGVYISNDDSNSWNITGLEGITSYSLHIHQNGNLFAGTGGFNNVYRLGNFEEGWIPLLSGIGNVISIMSTHSGDVLIGNWGQIHKTSNMGESWTKVLALGTHGAVTSIFETPNGKLYAGILSHFESYWGICRSSDGGDTWDHFGLLNKYISSLAVNSQGIIFAGSRGDHWLGGGGVYRSSDEGETWQELKNDVLVTAIAITPDDHIYIGCTNEHGHQGGVFRSTDNGETWELVNSGLIGWSNQNIEGLSLAPDGYLYAYGNHLHRSVDPLFTSSLIPHSDDLKVDIYPNPFTESVSIALPSNPNGLTPITVMVYDSLGNLVVKHQFIGQNLHSINLSPLKSGLYLIRIGFNGSWITKPVIKI